MVANWDWTVPLQHNIAILKPRVFDNSGLGLAIPYDFDLTGVVNVDYAVTPPEYKLNINPRPHLSWNMPRAGRCFRKNCYTF